MAKKGKGRGLFFFGTLGIALSLIPIMGKVKSVLKNTKKKAKKKRKKKRKKKIGKVFTKARKLLNMLPLWKLAMKIKWAVKKAALARKKTTKKSKKQSKTQAAVKQAKKNAKAAGKTYSVHDGEPITTLEDLQLVLGGGNHTRTSNEPSMIGQFIYSLLLEDIVTLVNPKSTTEERLLAGISMLPTSKPFKVLDAKKSTSKIIEDSRQTYTNNSKKNNGQKENGTFSNTNSNSSKTPEVEVTEKDVEALGEYYKKNLDKGTDKVKFSTNNLPKDPKELINNGWKDVTPEGMAKNTKSREIIDPETGMKVRFDPGKPGANGFEGKDHYHVHNPNSTGKKDYYLDINGNPVPKGSKASHIEP